jgi:glucose/arabinose dehydrogenase
MKKLLVAIMVVVATLKSYAQPQIQLQSFATGFTLPLGVIHAGDERLFVLEKSGIIKVIQPNGTINSTPFLDISSIVKSTGSSSSELGLLGLAFHPDYKTNGYFYVNYTRKALTTKDTTIIARYRVSSTDSNVANAASEKIVMIIPQPFSNHNGGCMHFGKDGYLYIGLGDGGGANDPQNNGQNKQSLLGKMLRIDVNNGTPYGIPADNPFVNDANALDEIWAYGLRNPWRFSFDKITGDMWMGDVGQDAWEEINFQAANSIGGENYGWKCLEGNAVFSTCNGVTGLTNPVYVYNHSNAGGYSVTGGYVYRSAKHKGAWGYYFFADAVTQHLWATDSAFNTSKVLNGTAGASNVSFGEDVYGNMYLVRHAGGNIQKLVETGSTQPKAYLLNSQNSYTVCEDESLMLEALFHPDLTYKWRKDGQEILGADAHTYLVTESGNYSVLVTDPTISNSFADSTTEISVTIIESSTALLAQNNYTADIEDDAFSIDTVVSGGVFSGNGVDANGIFDPSLVTPGTYEIIYTVTTNGCPQKDTAFVEVTTTVGIIQKNKTNTISIYPNPSNGSMSINSSLIIKTISITDIMGKEVHTSNPNSFNKKLTLNNISKGMYFVKIETQSGNNINRIIIE